MPPRCESTMPLRLPPAQERLPPPLEAKLTAWWKENHRGLLLPPMYPGHRHVWTGIDMGCTVCRVCGIAHVCASAQNVVKCDEIAQDHETICRITGVVLQDTLFVHGEISIQDYLGRSETNRPPPRVIVSELRIAVRTRARVVLDLLLYSDLAKQAFELERQRYQAKVSACLQAMLLSREWRRGLPTLPEFIEYVARKLSTTRIPSRKFLPPPAHWDRLVDSIAFVLNSLPLLGSPLLSSASADTHKLDNSIVGLLYIAPEGIWHEGAAFLVAEPYLHAILPLQISLQKVFGIHPKVITEAENHVKLLIKQGDAANVDRYALHTLGRPSRCPLALGSGTCACSAAVVEAEGAADRPL